MHADDLRNFLRFTTGSLMCVAESIIINFNSVTGLARRPFAHTCSNVLELPAAYTIIITIFRRSGQLFYITHQTSGIGGWIVANRSHNCYKLTMYTAKYTFTLSLYHIFIH